MGTTPSWPIPAPRGSSKGSPASSAAGHLQGGEADGFCNRPAPSHTPEGTYHFPQPGGAPHAFLLGGSAGAGPPGGTAGPCFRCTPKSTPPARSSPAPHARGIGEGWGGSPDAGALPPAQDGSGGLFPAPGGQWGSIVSGGGSGSTLPSPSQRGLGVVSATDASPSSGARSSSRRAWGAQPGGDGGVRA